MKHGLRSLRFLLVAALLVLATGLIGWAQTTTGTILGDVKDSTGAIVPGVSITIKNAETGFSRTLVTNELGQYRAPNLPLGTYEVNAEMTGFKKFTQTGIVLTVGREAVVDIALQVGGLTEQVTVTSEGQLVNTTSAQIEELVDQKKIRDLPLNGRDYLQLATLQPGVLIMRQQRTDIAVQTGTGLNISIGGGRPNQNNFRLDGISTNDHANSSPGSTTGANLGVEALREFSVLTNMYSAEYGRSAGGVINAVTRSGTNDFHGSAFYFHRNDNMDARNFFNIGGLPEFRRHQGGFAVGGPVFKDKTFFFTNYELLREELGVTTNSTVPSANSHQGILAGGNLPLDPKIKNALDLWPVPNSTVSGDLGVFISAPNRLAHGNFFMVRGDHTFTEKLRLNGSYTFDDAVVSQPDPLLLELGTAPARRQFYNAELTWVINPSLVNSIRFGLNHSDLAAGAFVPLNPKLADTTLGTVPGHGMAVIFVTGTSPQFPGATGNLDKEHYNFHSYQGYDNLTAIKKRHSLKMGFNFEVMRDDADSNQAFNGEWTFNSVRDLVANKPFQLVVQVPGSDTIRNLQQSVWGMYVQDDFRISQDLLINLGLRYEFTTDPSEANGKIASLVNLTDSATTVGQFFVNPTKKNFAPRIGFAWDPFHNGKTSIRGGFGIFYDLPLLNYLTVPALRIPPFFLRSSVSGIFAQGDYPTLGYGPVTKTPAYDADSVEHNPHPAYRMQYNLNLQHEVMKNTVVTLAYIGGRGVHLSRIGEDYNLATPIIQNGHYFFPTGQVKKINTPNKTYGRVRFWTFDGDSFYNSMQLGVNRRWAHGFQAQGSYTYSKTVDDWSTTFTSNQYRNSVANPYPLNRTLGRGLSDFDIRNVVIMNGTWDLPIKVDGGLGKLVNNWQLGGIFTGTSGLPFSVTMGGDPGRTLSSRTGSRSGQRPDQGATNSPIIGTVDQWFNPAGFTFQGAGYLGNTGRNTMTGPGLKSLDFSLVKDTPVHKISEAFRIQLRLEMFNALNHANFDIPTNTDSFTGSGALVPLAGRLDRTSITNRQVQVGLKIIF